MGHPDAIETYMQPTIQHDDSIDGAREELHDVRTPGPLGLVVKMQDKDNAMLTLLSRQGQAITWHAPYELTRDFPGLSNGWL